MRGNRVVRISLAECVSTSREINTLLEARDYARALELRGRSFTAALGTLQTLLRALPHPPRPGQRRLRLAILNVGAPAPGMNTAVRAAVRVAIDQGHVALGVRRGFQGLAEDDIQETGLDERERLGGPRAGPNSAPTASSRTARNSTPSPGRSSGTASTGCSSSADGKPTRAPTASSRSASNFPAFGIPMVCLPATIDNNVPGTELSIGADTALNNIVCVVDKIKQSAVAERRCYIVEVMGRRCGYLALMSGLATGAERVYLHEEGRHPQVDEGGPGPARPGLPRREAPGSRHPERGGQPHLRHAVHVGAVRGGERRHFAVRESILGHLQQGGDPSPFDRIQATKLARRCDQPSRRAGGGSSSRRRRSSAWRRARSRSTRSRICRRMIDEPNRRPKQQWWLGLRAIDDALARSGPDTTPAPAPVVIDVADEEG